MSYKEISPDELNKNPFTMIGKDWMLIAAEKDGKVNAMTASWGGLGVIWNKPSAYVFIRQTRYTKEFVDASERFTLSFFNGAFKKEMGYIGRVSGRDEDKIQKSGMNVSMLDGVPVFDEATTVIVCRKKFAQKFEEESFMDKSILERFYNGDSLHTMYIGEIEKILVKE